MADAVMVQGTSSDAGKSVVATGLCRLFWRMGFSTAPFKSQNMSQNSHILPDGREMARSQVIQAQACGVTPTPDMNPVLLKPSSQRDARVVIRGKQLGCASASEYRSDYYCRALRTIEQSYRRLASEHQIVVIEGAGSPVEMNLKDRDLVNMKIAEMASAAVILVADIDRGGVMASIVGTWQLLTRAERQRVIGFVINKFRGDPALFADGVEFIEEETGRPVLGVLPYLDLRLEPEDSLSLQQPAAEGAPRVAAVQMPSRSGGGDLYPLSQQDEIDLQFASSVGEVLTGGIRGLILPHSDDPASDLRWLRERGWGDLLRAAACAGLPVFALGCSAGLLGKRLHHEGGSLRGLGLLSASGWSKPDARSEGVSGRICLPGGHPLSALDESSFQGGRHCRMAFQYGGDSRPALHMCTGESAGVAALGSAVFGTSVARLFHHEDVRRAFCRLIGGESDNSEHKPAEQEIDLLADAIERHLDVERICRFMGGS